MGIIVYHLAMSAAVTNPIQVKEVYGKTLLDAFIRMPWSVYTDDPNWVPPLLIERREALSANNPFFKHAEWQAWIAYRGDRAVGRISAQIDRLYLEKHDDATGFFGMIEALDDAEVFAVLFEAAESWLKAKGMKRVLGPFNLGVNQEIGLLIEGFDTPPYVMMGHAQRHYELAVEKQGYLREEEILAYELSEIKLSMPKSMKKFLERQGPQAVLRPFNRKKPIEDFEILRSIFNDAWSNNWGFVPFTESEFQAVGKEMLRLIPSDFINIAEVDGKPAAFITMIPNVNEVIADLNGRLLPFGWIKLLWRLNFRKPKSGRVALMGVRQQFQNTRMGAALAFLTIEALEKPALRYGLERVELSWILESNRSMRNIIERIGGTISKRYRMYRKDLD